MGLNKFQFCSVEHKEDVEYCCFRSNKVFCQNCWFKDTHPFKCYSSRCGHFEKLAHLVIDRNLEMKVMHHLSEMSSSKQQYQLFYRRIFQLKEIITLSVKQDLENKLPLFLWSTVIEMLNKRNTKSDQILFEEGTCLEMLKVIKNRNSLKSENLELAVNQFQKISHLLGGLKNKNERKTYKTNLNKQVEECIQFFHGEAGIMIANLKSSMKNHMEAEVKRLLANFDPSIDYKGVKFNNKFNFANCEKYKAKDLLSQIFPQMDSNGKTYNGMDLSLSTLEQSPESLLEAAKSILKEKIFRTFHNIKEIKSSYPYKYGYIMATCLNPDQQYEKAVLKLQKLSLKMQKSSENPFLNSINLILMGPQLITVQFKNYPNISAEVHIYGSTKERQKACHYLITELLFEAKMTGSTNQMKKTIKQYPFEGQLSGVGRVYTYFELAYQHLFMNKDEAGEFEGQKYVQARGSKRLGQIVKRWQEISSIDFELQIGLDSIIPLFI